MAMLKITEENIKEVINYIDSHGMPYHNERFEGDFMSAPPIGWNTISPGTLYRIKDMTWIFRVIVSHTIWRT